MSEYRLKALSERQETWHVDARGIHHAIANKIGEALGRWHRAQRLRQLRLE